MADLERSRSELIALLPENQEGKGRIKTIREIVLTLFGHQAVTNPSNNNDSVDTAAIGVKFSIGSRWTNTNSTDHYICVDDRPTIAVWLNVASSVDLAAAIALVEAYADSGDAATLLSANTHSDAHDATTLAAANTHSDANDAVTLAASEAHSDAHDATTLASAEAYTDTQVAGRVPTTRTISTTPPMTGGGDLSTNRTFAVSVMVGSGGSHATGLVPDPPSAAGTAKYLREDGTWVVPPDTTGLTSVALAMPSFLSVSGSPLTSNGTITVTLATQVKNTSLLGPVSGSDAAPTFRTIDILDQTCHSSVRVSNSGNQSISNNTPTMITFDTETWDTASLHSTSSNTSRLTAAVAGKYHVCAQAVWAGNATGWRLIRLKKNNTTYYNGQRANALADATAGVHNCVSDHIDLSASDYVELEVTQTSGGNLNVVTMSLSMSLIGP